jgi:uncharacterized membrane protein
VSRLRGSCAVAGSLPWLRGLLGRGLPASLGRAIDQAFSALCHHLPDRTLVLRGEAMCVCSRCAGFYAGVAIAALLGPFFAVVPGRADRFRVALGAGLALMLVDVVTQDAGLHAPWHPVRLVTGAWVGGALATWMLGDCQRFSATLSRADRSASRKATLARPA